MEKMSRNQTIDLSSEEEIKYIARCLQQDDVSSEAVPINQIILGDSFEVMKHLPKSFVDLLIVDPPYNLAKNYHGDEFQKKSEKEYQQYTISWLELVLPLLKKEASVYICCDWQSSLIIGNVLQKYLNVRNRITWQREKGRGAKQNWKNGMEDIWFATVGEKYTFHLNDVKIRKRVIAPYRIDGKPKDWEDTDQGNFRNTCPSNFWNDITIPYWSMAENTIHPTQKPEKLMAKLILASSKEGDIVFDPFAGSGTTAVTAKKLKRNFIAVEQNKLYAALAEKRLEMANANSSIQGYLNGVFWERNTLSEQKKMMNRK